MPHPYDRTLSLRLDALIIQIEAGPPAVQRLALRYIKALLENSVPAFGQKAKAA